MGRKAKDMTGAKCGRWTVLRRDDSAVSGASKHARWICQCECGAVRSVFGHTLRIDGGSCGCLSREIHAAIKTKHGGYYTPEYGIWSGMLDRALGRSGAAKKWYTDRGIGVCERWRQFENFIADMGSRPSARHSLDRIDNDRGYEPGNCRWATPEEQQGNRRTCVRLTLNGETTHLAEWSRRLGVPDYMISARLKKGVAFDRIAAEFGYEARHAS
jgi:hypothetical protein